MCWHARFPRLTHGSVTFWAFRRADVGTFSKKTRMSTQKGFVGGEWEYWA